MTNLDESEDLLRRGEKERAYELVKEDRGISADILLNEGISFGIIGEYGISISYFELAEKIAEDDKIKEVARKNLAVAYFNRGNAYWDLKQHEEAIKDYNKALELNPNLAEAYNNRGLAYYKLNKHEEAIEDYNGAIKLNPKYAGAYHNRGVAYYEINKHEEAIKDYNKALELNPKYADAYNNRGNAYYKLNKHEEAIKDYNKALELNPKYTEAYYNRGNAYCELNRHGEAIEDYNKAIELNPKYAEVYNNRGNAYYKLNKHEEAIKDYNKAIELNPKDAAAAYNNRGTAYYKLKKHGEAIEDYTRAIELNPNLALPYKNRGITRLRTNEDLDKAIDDFKHTRDLFEGKDKERMLGSIEWVKARKEMNMKNWDGFRERMKEAKEIFEKLNDPLSRLIDAFIKFSSLDEKFDNTLNIPEPIEALKEIEDALKNLPEVEILIDPERTIFGARIVTFAILHDFISSMRGIGENTDLGEVKEVLTKLYKRSKEVEEMFESFNFDTGKTTIVDMQRIISSVKQEIEKIEWAVNKKQKALGILKEYWSRLSSAIKVMNGISTIETENVILGREIREIKSELQGGFADTIEEIYKAKEEILEEIYKTENILMQKDAVKARYRIEFPPPPSPAKIIVDIPIGKLTEKQIEEKAKEIAYKFKYLRGKVKKEFLEAIKCIPEMGDKLLKRLKKTKD